MIWRWFFNFFAGVSILLLGATIALWVRSYTTQDTIAFNVIRQTAKGYWFDSAGGGISIGIRKSVAVGGPGTAFNWNKRPTQPFYDDGSFWHRHHFAIVEEYFTYSNRRGVTLPHWLTAVGTAILPTASLLRRRVIRRPGGCSVCGYNPTANTSGVCPECGTTLRSKPDAGPPV